MSCDFMYAMLSRTKGSNPKEAVRSEERRRPYSDYTERRQKLIDLSRDLETLTMNVMCHCNPSCA